MGIAGRDWASGIPSPLAAGALKSKKDEHSAHPFLCSAIRLCLFCVLFCPFRLHASMRGKFRTQKNRMIFIIRFAFAEREGFEPPDPLRSTVFKTAAIDHSATSPSPCFRFGIANVRIKFLFANFNAAFYKKMINHCKKEEGPTPTGPSR